MRERETTWRAPKPTSHAPSKRGDWSVELMFSQRGPAYSNMVSLQRARLPLQWDRAEPAGPRARGAARDGRADARPSATRPRASTVAEIARAGCRSGEATASGCARYDERAAPARRRAHAGGARRLPRRRRHARRGARSAPHRDRHAHRAAAPRDGSRSRCGRNSNYLIPAERALRRGAHDETQHACIAHLRRPALLAARVPPAATACTASACSAAWA